MEAGNFAREGRVGEGAVREWRAWMERIRHVDEFEQLYTVNAWWNIHVQYQQEALGQDQWQTPEETLHFGSGDCEDIAIGKYVTLLNCGASPRKLRLLCGRLMDRAHMVVAYYEGYGQSPLILDNQFNALYPLIERPDLLPIYEVSAQGIAVRGKLTGKPHQAFNSVIRRAGLGEVVFG